MNMERIERANMLYRAKRKFLQFTGAVRSCFMLSWKTSALYTILRLVTSFVPAMLLLLEALLGKYMLDLLAGGFGQIHQAECLLLLACGILLARISSSLLQKAQSYMQITHDDIINRELSLRIMEKAGTVDIEYFDNADYYDKLTTGMRDAPVIAQLIWNTLSAVSAAFSVFITFIALRQSNIVYGIITIVAAAPSSAVAAKYTKDMYSLSIEQINGERKKGYYQNLLLSKQFAQDMRLWNGYGRIKKKYESLWTELFQARKSINKKRSIFTGVFECVPLIVIAIIGVDIALGVLSGKSSIGDYSLYTGLISQLWSGVFILSNAVMQIYDNQLKIANIQSLEEYRNRVLDEGTQHLRRVDTITFSHVYFQYPGTDKYTLKDVSFHVSKGEKVAIVGLNGSGKSTIIKLLLRLYDVSQGSIEINGVDIQKYALDDLRKNFSVYFQDSPSYCLDLRENIIISDGERENDEAGIMQAIADSGAEDILRKAPKGLDTPISRLFDESGIELSGGQYQLLAITRAFFRRHTALILDEPSSNLDPRAEHRLFEHMSTFTQHKTVLFTSHRLTNIVLADRIVVLEDGGILEEGTEKELLQHNGRFAELYHYQKSHYQEQERAN